MSIMSDRWIRSQCVSKDIPTPDRLEHGVTKIRPIPRERPMIEPFVDGQVRSIRVPAGRGSDEGIQLHAEYEEKKIVSYGLSSYGYDVRLGNKFKIFTNINNGVIDPLKMNDNCYVDFEGDRCIIPPNSYVLGHTVEYFRIPRDIMVICLGKCLAGDTLITDPETGEIIPMAETEGLRKVTALDLTTGKLGAFETEKGLINNGVLPMKKLITSSGHEITATYDHPFRVWSGWKSLSELRPGDRIAVARSEPFVGKDPMSVHEARLLGFMTADGQCYVPGGSPTFTNFDKGVVEVFTRDAEQTGFVCSVVDERGVIRLMNKLDNGGLAVKNRASLWLESHGLAVKTHDKKVPKSMQRANKEAVIAYLSALFTCDGSFQLAGADKNVPILEYYTVNKLFAEQLRIMLRRFGLFFRLSKVEKSLNGKKYDLYILRTTSADTIRLFHEQIGMIGGSRKESVLSDWYSGGVGSKKSNFDTLPPEAWVDLDRILERLNLSYRSIGMHPNRKSSVPLAPLREFARNCKDPELLALVDSDVVWDTVSNIEDSIAQAAYDYTVPVHHNFVANGIVVHNSTYARAGAIINVTPIEPEFEGQVVIEISNATNLPLTVHANQGIAQFLFLRGEEPCEVSYADRGGKYQGQRGVVTARV